MWDGYRAEDKTGYCEKVSGCCFFISREYVEKTNYFDETVFMYCEEPILANSASKMKMFLKSRLYYIQTYSGYNLLQKKAAIASRKLQYKLWEKQMK